MVDCCIQLYRYQLLKHITVLILSLILSLNYQLYLFRFKKILMSSLLLLCFQTNNFHDVFNDLTYIHVHVSFTIKKTGLLRRLKTAAQAQKTTAKGPFSLLQRRQLRRFYLLALRRRNSSIAAVTKNATINASFSGVFGFLRWTENHCHMRSKFMSIDFQQQVMLAATGNQLNRTH